MNHVSPAHKSGPHPMAHPPARPVSHQGRPASLLAQVTITLGLAFSLLVFLLLVTPVGYGLAYNGRIFPGIWVAGVELSGLPADEAASLNFLQWRKWSKQGSLYKGFAAQREGRHQSSPSHLWNHSGFLDVANGEQVWSKFTDMVPGCRE